MSRDYELYLLSEGAQPHRKMNEQELEEFIERMEKENETI